MTLRCKVDEETDVVCPDQVIHEGLISDVSMDKCQVFGIGGKAGTIACIGERIKNHKVIIRVGLPPVINKIRADKSGAAGDEEIHKKSNVWTCDETGQPTRS